VEDDDDDDFASEAARDDDEDDTDDKEDNERDRRDEDKDATREEADGMSLSSLSSVSPSRRTHAAKRTGKSRQVAVRQRLIGLLRFLFPREKRKTGGVYRSRYRTWKRPRAFL
jgi:hypothetical protein